MVGVITGSDILAHPLVTIECFGWQVFFKALLPWQGKTFLDLLQPTVFPKTQTAKRPSTEAHAILQRCIDLELRAKRIYTVLGRAFDEQCLVGAFFAGLAEQEQYHADLLEVCRVAAIRRGWRMSVFNPWQEYLPRLEQQMDAAEAAVRNIDSIDAALRLVIDIESSEVNKVFHAALAATEAPFVRKLRAFKQIMEAHMTYIVERIPELSPKLMLECRELRARFPQLKA